MLAFGKPGSGKTHAMCAVAEQLVLRGHSVPFATCSLLVQDLLDDRHVRVGFFQANAGRIGASVKPGDNDFQLHVVELRNTGATTSITLATFVALCTGVLGRAVPPQTSFYSDPANAVFKALGGAVTRGVRDG